MQEAEGVPSLIEIGESSLVTDVKKVPITIITGFLGSGKTTLLQHILKGDHGLKIAVLMNEFAETNEMEKLITTQKAGNIADEWIEFDNGCLCCSAKDAAVLALESLLKKRSDIDHIIIETSGMANPAPIIQKLWVDEALECKAQLDGVVCLVDSSLGLARLSTESPGYSKEAAIQVALSDVVVLNKCELVDQARIESIIDAVKDINPISRIERTSYSCVSLELILNISEYRQCETKDPSDILKMMNISSHTHSRGLHHSFRIDIAKCVQLNVFEKWLFTLLWERTLIHSGEFLSESTDIMRVKGILFGRSQLGQQGLYALQAVEQMYDLTQLRDPYQELRCSIVFIALNRDLCVNFVWIAVSPALKNCLFDRGCADLVRMGIKGFSTWLRTKFPVAFTNITKLPCTFDEVYIDLNSYLHKSASHCNTPKQVLRRLEYNIQQTLRYVRARKRVFVSIDGVAPAAKLDVQRARRASKSLESTRNSIFDAQHFTPGCIFMGRVEDTLRKIGEKYAQEHGPDFEFIISGASVKEEGEIKIARELALQHNNIARNKRVIRAVLTVDSDAFLQAFVHEIPSLFILNAQDLKNGAGCFSGEIMRDEFKRSFPDADNPRQLQLDFALLSIFSGNDCLPGMPFGGITFTWPNYIEFVANKGYAGIVDVESLLINPAGLAAFAKFIVENKMDGSMKKLFERHVASRTSKLTNEVFVDYLKSAQWSFSRLLGYPLAQSLSLFLSPSAPAFYELAEMDVAEVSRLFQEGCLEAKDNRQDKKKVPGAAAIMMLDPNSEKSVEYIAKPLRSLFMQFHQEDSLHDDHTRFKKLCTVISEIPKDQFTAEELRVTFADLPAIYSRRKKLWKPYDPSPLKTENPPASGQSIIPCPMLSKLYAEKLSATTG